MKRPAFQFYPADWRKDAALQSCSIAARGLWLEAMCIAHECDPYGHLTVNGKAMTPAQIARLVGISPRECSQLLAELEEAGVSSTTEEGAIFSRRMVRDEDLRNRRASGGTKGAEHGIKGAEAGSKGGRPPKERGVTKPPLEPPPSSSSSSSPSGREKRTQPEVADPPPQRALSSVEGFEPTAAGLVCRAMRQAGMQAVNPGDPRLLALLEQGATPAEFAGLAAEAVPKGKGFAWVLTVLQARREEASAIRLAPAPADAPDDPKAWTKTRSGVMARAGNLGIEAWNGDPREWPRYLRQVIEADKQQHSEKAA